MYNLKIKVMKGFKIIDSDCDYVIREKIINGRITKARYKTIAQYVRKNTFSNDCGCEWDCCGHLTSKTMNIVGANSNHLVLSVVENYNY